MSFDDARSRMDWRQGEHITLIGPTGRGKTELLIGLIQVHPWVLFLGTKRVDSTQRMLRTRYGFRVIADPAELNHEVSTRFVFRPPFPKANAADLKKSHREAFRSVIMRAFRQTGWTVCLDEARYIADFLGLRDELLLLWLQGRSQGNTVVACTQRPRYVPLEAYDQATHLFFWQDPDRGNIDRVAELAGVNRNLVLRTVPSLAHHDVFYVNTVTQESFITNTRW